MENLVNFVSKSDFLVPNFIFFLNLEKNHYKILFVVILSKINLKKICGKTVINYGNLKNNSGELELFDKNRKKQLFRPKKIKIKIKNPTIKNYT